jgi:hypothetical protein
MTSWTNLAASEAEKFLKMASTLTLELYVDMLTELYLSVRKRLTSWVHKIAMHLVVIQPKIVYLWT